MSIRLSRPGLPVLLALLLILDAPVTVPRAEAAPAAATAPVPPKELTAEQQAAMKILADDLARLDALLQQVTDRAEKGSVKSILDGFKDRRAVLATTFDQVLYDELLLSVAVEQRRLIAFMAPLATPPREKAAKP